jgi:hypothetical protein
MRSESATMSRYAHISYSVINQSKLLSYSTRDRPLGGASGALAPGADFEGAPKKAVNDRPYVNT